MTNPVSNNDGRGFSLQPRGDLEHFGTDLSQDDNQTLCDLRPSTAGHTGSMGFSHSQASGVSESDVVGCGGALPLWHQLVPGGYYEGELRSDSRFLSGERPAYGRMHYNNGDFYEGFWGGEGEYSQNGRLQLEDGRVFQFRDWLRGQPCRDATLSYPDGRYYQGELRSQGSRDFRPHGAGSFFEPQGICYRGDWYFGLPHGWGEITWPQGVQEFSRWRSGRRDGLCKLTYPEKGITVESVWKEGQLVAGEYFIS